LTHNGDRPPPTKPSREFWLPKRKVCCGYHPLVKNNADIFVIPHSRHRYSAYEQDPPELARTRRSR
jgi:hypothetical protein